MSGWCGGAVRLQTAPASLRCPPACLLTQAPSACRRWGYWSTDGLGLFEYLLLSEELGAEPVWVVNNGGLRLLVGKGGGLGEGRFRRCSFGVEARPLHASLLSPLLLLPPAGIAHNDQVPSRDVWSWVQVRCRPLHMFVHACRTNSCMEHPAAAPCCPPLTAARMLPRLAPTSNAAASTCTRVQEALDGVEFISGPPDSPWGSVRAAMGRPHPWKLNYLAIGNEVRAGGWQVDALPVMVDHDRQGGAGPAPCLQHMPSTCLRA